jgi:PEP-CTERM motif
MKRFLELVALTGLMSLAVQSAQAQNLLTNGNLDVTYQQVIVDNAPPGEGPEDFFLPKPASWQNVGTRVLTGPYEDEMSSEPWAGPAPTPVTTDGVAGDDWGVFFKPFSGNVAPNGPATGRLYQDLPGTPGQIYQFSMWAGAEPNFLGGAEMSMEFLDGTNTLISGFGHNLIVGGLLTPNGQPFNYKQFVRTAAAPPGTVTVRVSASMINATANPLGGGQAFVVDDFVLTAIPEPSTISLGLAGLLGFAALKRRR